MTCRGKEILDELVKKDEDDYNLVEKWHKKLAEDLHCIPDLTINKEHKFLFIKWGNTSTYTLQIYHHTDNSISIWYGGKRVSRLSSFDMYDLTSNAEQSDYRGDYSYDGMLKNIVKEIHNIRNELKNS